MDDLSTFEIINLITIGLKVKMFLQITLCPGSCVGGIYTTTNFFCLKSIATINKSEKILLNIMDVQWSSLNEATFLKIVELLEKKHVTKHEKNLDALIKECFAYLQKVWISNGENKWCEGAHPWHVSNNQGVKGCNNNKEIKQCYTFRCRLDIGELILVLSRLVHEWSKNDDKLLENSRLAMMDEEKLSLSYKTKGYQWFMNNEDLY